MSDRKLMTAAEAITDALERWKTANPGVRPSRVLLGHYAYEKLHEEAKAAGMPCEPYPRTEEERLEYKGMKVCCHQSSGIEFEP